MAKEVKIETEIKRRILKDEYPEFSSEDAEYIAKRLLKEGHDYSDLHDLVETCRKEVREYWAQDFDKVRTSRGILPEVWNRRPYVRWPAFENQGLSEVRIIVDRDAIEEGYAGLSVDQIRYMKTLAGRSPGWVITRHRAPGAEKVYPEIRPDHKVETGPPIRHWHGEGPLTWGMRKRFKDMGISVIVRGTEAFRQHCNKINAEKAESAPCARPHEWVTGWHEHKDEAKYVFAPSGKVPMLTTHHHDEGDPGRYFRSNPDEFAKHLENWHVKHPETVEYHGPNTGWHTHTRMVKRLV
jgi:hypothetical protein